MPSIQSSSIRVFLLLAVVVGPALCLAGSAGASQGDDKQPIVILDTSMGPITIELDPEKAPKTVENFLAYVDDKFFDNLVFHRVIPHFMIQGGGLDVQLREKNEGKHPSVKNESGNGLSNARGTIAMARTNDPNSATCQFFINLVDNQRLDGASAGTGYTVFGKVVDGMDVVDQIANVKTTTRGIYENVPVNPVVIKSARRKGKS
jgi:peptidyl-prolyl cis-trans isomerase A (cyclophilin A)